MKSEDIAKLAGVSRSTVSRVINNYPNVPEATRLKVMDIVRAHNYVPNTFARTLAGKKSNTIGLFFVVTGDHVGESRIARNDYFSSYLSYLVDISNSADYYVLVSTISEESDYEKVNQAFLEKRIDGGIIIGTQDDSLQKIHVESIQAPLVIFDYDKEKLENANYSNDIISIVNSNDFEGMDKAVQDLKDKGHEQIGFIKGNVVTRSARVRYEGYKRAMSKHRLKINEDFIIEGNFSMEIAYENMTKAIESGKLPTAYISANDYMAIEAMKALKEHGIRVPEDVAMIGFDNVHLSEQSSPTLTTLEPKFYEMAKRAVQVLDHYIVKSKISLPKVIEYGVDLIERESC